MVDPTGLTNSPSDVPTSRINYQQFKNLPADEAIKQAATYAGVGPEIMNGIWNTESSKGANKGPSSAGALGDFQILPSTQTSLEKRFGMAFDPNDFHDSLYMASEVMRENKAHFGNDTDALKAYNGGWNPEKWRNPETAAYPGKVQGSELTQAFGDSQHMPTFLKSRVRNQALTANDPITADEAGQPGAFTDGFEKAVAAPAMYPEDASRLAHQQEQVGFTEALLDSVISNTVTAKLFAISQQGAFDSTFDAMSEENVKRAKAAKLWGNDQLMDYVNGARNAADYSERLSNAQERQDFMRRMSNTEGWSKAGAVAASLIGGMIDPPTIIGSIGTGAVVAMARGAAATSRAMVIAQGAGMAAGENVAIGQVIESADNQRFNWGTLFEQASMGAALGAVGGLLVGPRNELTQHPNVTVPPDYLPMLTQAHMAVKGTMDTTLDRAYTFGQTHKGVDAADSMDHALSTEIHDLPSHEMNLTGKPELRAVEQEGGPVIFEGLPEEPKLHPTNGFNPRLGYKPEPTLASKDYWKLHEDGVITELRTADDLAKVSDFQSKYGQKIPEDAKAVYIPQEDRVYVFRDRLTQAEIENPTGLVAHEVGVHYGLERAVGTENYRRILGDIDKSTDPRVREAKAAVPSDTPEHIRLEEVMGYLAEKHPAMPIVKQFIANLRNWLRENVRMFRGMEVSVNDALAYVKGSVEHVRNEGRLFADTTFPYVWHGSPVKGIESLDIKHAGSGEGKSAFGFGHYVTSEKGTALDYRNKESARRGRNREDGGLYRLKVEADPEKMVNWDTPVEGSTAAAFRKAGIGDEHLQGTGGEAYSALSDALGSQRAASEALAAHGVPGIRYQTGRTRGSDKPNSNYVLFDNASLSMAARYSRSGEPTVLQDQPLTARESRVAEGLSNAAGKVAPAAKELVEKLQGWLAARPEFMKKWDKWASSPGVTLSTSPSVHVQNAGAVLFENAMGSGVRPAAGTVSMNYEMLHRGYRDNFLIQASEGLVELMTPKEKAAYMMGMGKSVTDRLSTQVAEERLKHRYALERGEKNYQSSAPPGVQRLAKLLDDQVHKMASDGSAYGSTYAGKVMGSGTTGFLPQTWSSPKFRETLTNNPAQWAALKKNFTQQYVEKQVDPVISRMIGEGIDPVGVQAVRTRLMEQVNHQVDTRMAESVRDPSSRSTMDSSKFEQIASQLLQENFQGITVTNDTVSSFRKLLGEHVRDRSRTEFDMLRTVDGVRLLDFIDHDVVSTISHTAHRFAGQNAMAKAGFKDLADFEALVSLAAKDGARPVDLELLKFAGRSYGFEAMIAQDHVALAAIRNLTYAATMGKLGIAQLADAANTITAIGVGKLPALLGGMVSRESDLVKQLGEMFGTGITGTDYRITSMTADVLPNGRAMVGMGERLLKVSQKAAQLVSWVNGSNFVGRIMHKAFLPIMTENLVRAARGLDGGMSPRRLADTGLTTEALDRIKGQLDKYEPNRQSGDAFHWDKWDDQQAADKFVEAMHRVTYQTFQRTLIGEGAMWRSESALGTVVGQFHNFGLTSMEKQLGRNLGINDTNTYTAMAVGMAWSTLLFYSRLQLNTAGMTAADAKEYMTKNTEKGKLVQGVLTYFNMSGIAAEAVGMGEVIFGGNTYGGNSTPVASIGFFNNATKAGTSVGSLVTGQSTNHKQDARNILRILPGGNSIAGSYFSNQLRD